MSVQETERSEQGTPETATTPSEATPAPLFDESELKEFDREDVEAGRNICKMLSLFFFYTVIVMALATYVTMQWVSQ